MNDASRMKIRRTARLLHGIAQTALALNLAFLLVYTTLFQSAVPEAFHSHILTTSATTTLHLFDAWDTSRETGLIAFPPPADPSARAEWAARVERHMGQPVAVFVRKGGTVEWAGIPDALAPAAARGTDILTPKDDAQRAARVDTVGDFRFVRTSFAADSLLCHLRLVSDLRSGQGWGVVYEFYRGWQSFFAECAGSAGSERRPWMPRMAEELLQMTPVEADALTTRTGLIASLGDWQIFRSPGVDTTAMSWTSNLDPLRIEYFLSKQDQVFAGMLGNRVRPWRIAAIVALMLLCYFNWRWIKKLTAPHDSRA